MQGTKANIRRILESADKIDIEEGRVAYFRYNEVCRRFSEYYAYPLEKVISVFAALSPNNDYFGNLRSMATVLLYHSEGIPPEFCKIATYNHCRNRAFDYLNGVDFLGTVKGEKIRNFYQNILNPLDPFPVTIDGHAVNIWRGKRVNLKKVVEVGGWNYKEVATAYREIASEYKLAANQLQAITWFCWKRIHRIYFKGQFELFDYREGDFWRTIYTPEEITPFPPNVPPPPEIVKPKIEETPTYSPLLF